MDDQKPDSPDALTQLGHAVPEAVAGVAGGLVGYALGGVPGAAAGAAVTPAMRMAWDLGGMALMRRLTRGSRVLEIAAQQLDITTEALGRAATADPARLELLARVLESAGRTALDEKVDALGRILAMGLGSEGAALDHAFLIAAALDELEEPHLRFLRFFERASKGAGVEPDLLFDVWQVMADFGSSGPMLDLQESVNQTLVRHGLAAGREPTELGRALLRILANDTADET